MTELPPLDFHLEVPQDSAVVWRFLDFPKFLSILHRRELWFSSPGKFSDPWDGHYPVVNSNHENVATWIRDMLSANAGLDEEQRLKISNELIPVTHDLELWRQALSHLIRDQYGISCWHISPHEPDAFWTLYSDRIFGVAIKSSVGRIKKALEQCSRKITMGAVSYKGLEEPQFPSGILQQFFWKRPNFQFERELRLVVAFTSPQTMLEFLTKPDLDYERRKGGTGVSIDVNLLIDSVVVSPLAPKWFEETVREIAIRFNQDLKFEPSALATTPTRLS